MLEPKRKKTGGRKKGVPNVRTALLKDSILEAAELAGDSGGIVAYLQAQATDNPAAFMTLLGRVLPTQVVADVTSRDAPAIVSDQIMTPDEWAEQWASYHKQTTH